MKIAIIGLGYVGLPFAHNEFKNLDIKTTDTKVVYDIKGILDKEKIDARL